MEKLQGVYFDKVGIQGVKLSNGMWRTYDNLEEVLKDFGWNEIKNKMYYSM